MKYRIIRMHFDAPLHAGGGSLSDGEYAIPADTLFSALFLEAMRMGGGALADRLVETCKAGGLLISDAMPFLDGDYYVPKPILLTGQDEAGTDAQGAASDKGGQASRIDRTDTREYRFKKAYKKLKYIPLELLGDYLESSRKGDDSFDPVGALEDFGHIGKGDLRVQVQVGGDPYDVGSFTFEDNAGLYVLVGYADGVDVWALPIFESLQYSGLGGERSSGYGRFRMEVCDAEDFLPLLDMGGGETLMTHSGPSRVDGKELPDAGGRKTLMTHSGPSRVDGKELPDAGGGKTLMSLSVCMAQDGELDSAVQGATWTLRRRGGFIYSADYSDSPRRKRDFYSFAAGSCFRQGFGGDVFDVSEGGAHPVWRYGKPLFVSLSA
jgi:CRISPR-associated protein Csm4